MEYKSYTHYSPVSYTHLDVYKRQVKGYVQLILISLLVGVNIFTTLLVEVWGPPLCSSPRTGSLSAPFYVGKLFCKNNFSMYEGHPECKFR